MTAKNDWRDDNNPGHQRRLELWRAIEDEFGEPLPAIIVGLREQGNSWRTVAGALGVNVGVLQQWRHALGLPFAQNHKIFDPSSYPSCKPSDIKAQQLGYADALTAIADMRLNQGMTVKQIGARLGIHYQTVSKRSPEQAKGRRGSSAHGRAIHRQQVKTRKRGGHQHIWSKDNDIVFANAKTTV